MLFSGHLFACSFAFTAGFNSIDFNVLNMKCFVTEWSSTESMRCNGMYSSYKQALQTGKYKVLRYSGVIL